MTVPVAYRTKWCAASWYHLPLVVAQSFPYLLFFSIRHNISLFHCRSYAVTLPAVLVQMMRGVKLIFDPRSDFPEEHVVAGNWSAGSFSYWAWKALERVYLKRADAVIAVTDTHKEHLRAVYGPARLLTVYNNVDTDRFKPDEAVRKRLRLGYNIGENEVLFCYCGSLGAHWNDPEIYAGYLIRCRSLAVKHRFLFITPDVAALAKVMAEHGIEEREYLAVSADFRDVPHFLAMADLGLVLMGSRRVVAGVKTAEYLAAGLPVITNEKLAGAVEIVEGNGVGMVDRGGAGTEALQQFLNGYPVNRATLAARCRKTAESVFSNRAVCGMYAKLYRELVDI